MGERTKNEEEPTTVGVTYTDPEEKGELQQVEKKVRIWVTSIHRVRYEK